MIKRLSTFALAFLCAGSAPAFADTGKIGLAYPIADIAIDGNLDDWPDDLIRYPILHNDDGAPVRDESDFKGEFRIGYNAEENALYVGVDIQDDSVIIRGEDGPDWARQDGCELYLYGHKPGENTPTQYRLWGEHLGLYGPGSLQEVQVEIQWREDGYSCEWRINIDQHVDLQPGLHLGFDLSIWDRDAHGPASWIAWSKGVDKYRRADRLGSLVLLEKNAAIGDVLGAIGNINEGRMQMPGTPRAVSAGYQMFFSGVLMAITFLHLLLFVFNRDTRANLFYAIYTAITGAAIFSGLQLEFRSYMDPLMVRAIKEVAYLCINLSGLAFLYALFHRVPKRFYFQLVLFILPAIFGTVAMLSFDLESVLSPVDARHLNHLVLRFANLLLLVETVLALIGGVRRRAEGAWIIGIGFIAFAANVSPLIYATETDVTTLYWVLIPLISMSVYMARGVARTNHELKAQLVHVEELSAKTQEQYAQIQEQNAQIREANRLKSDFLARMSHDLRTPMNAIIGYTRILLRKSKDTLDERQYKNLTNVHISAKTLLDLINDILDLSKIESGRVELKAVDIDLKALTQQCATAVEPLLKPGVELRYALEDLPPLRTDEDRVRRALMNLLSNAVKFTEVGYVEVSLRAKDDGIALSITDTGIGIPQEDLPHIFDEFRQVDAKNGARHQGTGLGLAIVKRSVEMLGGTVAAASEEGVGSIFTIRLYPLP